MDRQLRLSIASAFLFESFHFVRRWCTNSIKSPMGHWSNYLQIKNSDYGCNRDSQVNLEQLFASVHSLYVVEIVVLQLFPLQFKCICDEACLRGPRLWTQMNFNWNLKPLEFNYSDEKERRNRRRYSAMNDLPFFLTVYHMYNNVDKDRKYGQR